MAKLSILPFSNADMQAVAINPKAIRHIPTIEYSMPTEIQSGQGVTVKYDLIHGILVNRTKRREMLTALFEQWLKLDAPMGVLRDWRSMFVEPLDCVKSLKNVINYLGVTDVEVWWDKRMPRYIAVYRTHTDIPQRIFSVHRFKDSLTEEWDTTIVRDNPTPIKGTD